MWYVIAAYIAVTALFACYIWTLVVRQRTIAELAEAAGEPKAGGVSP